MQTEVTMKYIYEFTNFLTHYDFIILPCISFVLALFCITNFCKNVYRKQNRKLRSITRKICAYPHMTAQYAAILPKQYQRQWRAYTNSGANQPSLVFEFVPIDNSIRLLRLLILSAVVCSLYIVAFAFNTTHFEYIIYQVVFLLAFTLVMVADKLLFKVRENKAKQVFARLVNELNLNTKIDQITKDKTDTTVKELRELQKCKPTNAVFERASELLHDKGLNAYRTPEEQRKLNTALNGLLQSYTKNNA